MFNAKDAKKCVSDWSQQNNSRDKTKLINMLADIKSTAKTGLTSQYYTKSTTYIRTELQNLGFNVECDGRDGSSAMTVSW